MSEPSPFILGQVCYLRALVPADADGDYVHWLNDPEVTRYMETGRMPTRRDLLQEFIVGLAQNPNSLWFAICDLATHKHIGNISLQDIHRVHRRATLGIMIGDKQFWGKGYAQEATALLVGYGFRRWNLNSIWLGVLASHAAAIRVYEKVGFQVDGRTRESWWADGQYHDVLNMSLLARNYFAQQKG